LRLFLDSSASDFEAIAVSGGRRGVQLELGTEALLVITGGVIAHIADD
jgi:prolyl-tRNA editing enzyme YbaK/EbsC (Cys-tRNA(Pro) deacylase)